MVKTSKFNMMKLNDKNLVPLPVLGWIRYNSALPLSDSRVSLGVNGYPFHH